MAKLNKQLYTTSKGEKKTNCYTANIPKRVVKSSGISDYDEIKIYAEEGKIIIEKVCLMYVCMGCGYEWESNTKEYCCPKCRVGDIYCDDEEENNDNQEPRIKEND